MPIFEWDTPGPSVTPPTPDVSVAYDDSQYSRQLKQLLPPGVVWNLDADSQVSRTLLAIAGELARVDARGLDLIDESDPRTATETIEDWERILSLPDDRVLVIPSTIEERRVAVTQKFVAREGQNVDFFVRLSAACGFTLLPAGPTPTPVISSVAVQSTSGGTLLHGTNYGYRVAALNDNGITRASATVAHLGTVGGTNTQKLQVSWGLVPGATSYRVYGRVSASELLLATVAGGVSGFIDDGSLTATGPLPVAATATDEPITKFARRLLRAGFRVNDRCYDAAFAYAMRLNVLSESSAALSHADFERVIRHVTHSHIVDIFNYL